MSNNESFIDEVTEEVRRDRLYAILRRWGWVAVLAVLVLVGGAIWTEWSRSQRQGDAEAFGDAVLAALRDADPEASAAALGAIAPGGPDQAAVLSLLRAATLLGAAQAGGDAAAAGAARDELLALADGAGIEPAYRHLALLKAMLAGGTGNAGRDGAILDELATPGAPYRTLAVELQALRALDAGDEATALTLLRALTEDAEATQALRRRAQQTIVALGASLEPA